MQYTAKGVVYSEINEKQIDAMWAPCRIFEC